MTFIWMKLKNIINKEKKEKNNNKQCFFLISYAFGAFNNAKSELIGAKALKCIAGEKNPN